MSIDLRDGTICLSGDCGAEEAEALLAALQGNPGAAIDLSSCTAAHSAVVQILLVARPTIRAAPREDFMQNRVLPLLIDGDTDTSLQR